MTNLERALLLLNKNGEKVFCSNLFKKDCKKNVYIEGGFLRKKTTTVEYEITDKLADQIVNRFNMCVYGPILYNINFDNEGKNFAEMLYNTKLLHECLRTVEPVYKRQQDTPEFDEKVKKLSDMLVKKVTYQVIKGSEMLEKECIHVDALNKEELQFLSDFTQENRKIYKNETEFSK